MADEKPTTVEDTPKVPERKPNGKVANPRELVWPKDPWGFTSMLRKEGVRAIGRIKGNDDKLDIFLATVGVLVQHAKTKIEGQKKTIAQSEAAAKNRAEAAYVTSLKQQEEEVKRLADLLASAEAALAAKKEMPESAEK